MPLKKHLAALLAALQLAWSFSAGTYEALAQNVHSAPVHGQASGFNIIAVPATGNFSSLQTMPVIQQTSLAAPPIAGLTPLVQTPAAVATPVLAVTPQAVHRLHNKKNHQLVQPIARDTPAEGSRQAGDEAFAEVYPEKLIESAAGSAVAAPVSAAAPSASASLPASRPRPTSQVAAAAADVVPAPAAPAPVQSVWHKPAVQAALGAAAIAGSLAAFGIATTGTIILGALGIPWILKLGWPWSKKNSVSGPEAVKDVALAGPLMWFSAASLLSLVSLGRGSSPLWYAVNGLGVAQSLAILGQLNAYKKDPKALLATAATIVGVGAAIALVATQAILPLSAGLTASFWAAMGLLWFLDAPQVQRNYHLYVEKGRTPEGISAGSKALLVLGSLMHFYAAFILMDVPWMINAGIAVVMGSTILSQMYFPHPANAVLGPIVLAVEKLISLFRPANAAGPAAATPIEEARALVAKEFAGTDYTRFKGVGGQEALASLVEKVKTLPGRSVIMLEAPTAAGKSTLSAAIDKALPGRIVVFPVDRYFRAVDEVPKGVDGKPDFDHPDSLYLERAAQDVKTLLEGGRVELPLHVINGGTRWDSGEFLQLDKDDVVIIDSIYASHEFFVKATQEHKSLNVYLTAPTAVRFARRLKRDIVERGISAEKNLQMLPQILINEREHILPLRAKADMVLNLVGEEELKRLPETYAEILAKNWEVAGKDAGVTELFSRMIRASVAADAMPAPLSAEIPQVDVTGTPQSPDRLKTLIDQAVRAYTNVQDDHAHQKNFSDFHVHAGVELADGRWFSAGNVELSRELTLCAERAAIAAALDNSKISQIVKTVIVSNSGAEFKKLCAECLGWLSTGKYFSPETQIVSVARNAASGRFSLKIRTLKELLPFHVPSFGLASTSEKPIDSLKLDVSPRAAALKPSDRELKGLMSRARGAYVAGSAESFSSKPAAAAVSLAPFGRASAVRFQWAPRFSEAEDLQAASNALEKTTRLQTRLRTVLRFLDRVTFGKLHLEDRFLSAPKITALAYYGKDTDMPRIPSLGRLVKQGASKDTLILRIENDRIAVRTLDEYMPEIYGLP
jgi:uridine kinase/cytidine deaminase